jgi:hypothetical protein
MHYLDLKSKYEPIMVEKRSFMGVIEMDRCLLVRLKSP